MARYEIRDVLTVGNEQYSAVAEYIDDAGQPTVIRVVVAGLLHPIIFYRSRNNWLCADMSMPGADLDMLMAIKHWLESFPTEMFNYQVTDAENRIEVNVRNMHPVLVRELGPEFRFVVTKDGVIQSQRIDGPADYSRQLSGTVQSSILDKLIYQGVIA